MCWRNFKTSCDEFVCCELWCLPQSCQHAIHNVGCLLCPHVVGTVDVRITHVLAQSFGKLDTHTSLPSLSTHIRCTATLLLYGVHGWEVVFQQQIIRMAYARKGNEGNTRTTGFAAESDNNSAKSHSLGLPRCQCPA